MHARGHRLRLRGSAAARAQAQCTAGAIRVRQKVQRQTTSDCVAAPFAGRLAGERPPGHRHATGRPLCVCVGGGGSTRRARANNLASEPASVSASCVQLCSHSQLAAGVRMLVTTSDDVDCERGDTPRQVTNQRDREASPEETKEGGAVGRTSQAHTSQILRRASYQARRTMKACSDQATHTEWIRESRRGSEKERAGENLD